ncbi:Retrovirus-related Pol polyprotein from transposon opus, partial [Mucuna pruriens]
MEWNKECHEAFEKVKQYLETPHVLVPTIPGKPLILYLTVLEESMGCILGQQEASGKKEHAIYYLSKKFTDWEQRYPTLERTCCVLVWTVKRLRQYMLAHTTWLIAKTNPLKYIFKNPALIGRIACWQMTLSEYNIVYTSQKAIKGSALAEQLAHHPLDDYQPLLHEFSDEHIMSIEETESTVESAEWKPWFDGASNILGNRIGAILASLKGQCFPFLARLGFDCINNMVEYEACAMGITMAIDHQVKKLKVFGDLMLVIYQLHDKRCRMPTRSRQRLIGFALGRDESDMVSAKRRLRHNSIELTQFWMDATELN